MTLPRPYRNSLSSNEAMAQIVAGSGTQFDPDLVTEFTAMLGYRGRIAQSA